MIDPVAKIKRGRGRPVKDAPVIYWSEIEPGRSVEITGVAGAWTYVKMSDGGASVTVIGGPNGHTRTFTFDRVIVCAPRPSDG